MSNLGWLILLIVILVVLFGFVFSRRR